MQPCYSRKQGDYCSVLIRYRLIEGWSWVSGKALPPSEHLIFPTYVRYRKKENICSHLIRKSSFQHTIYIPQPTWGNHPKIFTIAGLTVRSYRYFDPATRGLNFRGPFPCQQDEISFPIFKCFSVYIHLIAGGVWWYFQCMALRNYRISMISSVLLIGISFLQVSRKTSALPLRVQ